LRRGLLLLLLLHGCVLVEITRDFVSLKNRAAV
jgi:hypothetical protein